jgi:hypothetical protein
VQRSCSEIGRIPRADWMILSDFVGKPLFSCETCAKPAHPSA